MKSLMHSIILIFMLHCTAVLAAEVNDEFIEQNILGEHDFTLQWLDNFNRGNKGLIAFEQEGELIMARGYQEEDNEGELNYMELNGELRVVSPKEIHITGVLITRVDHIQGGKEYTRNGTFIFKAYQQRQYWRLQNMREHEVMDYVDIHFK